MLLPLIDKIHKACIYTRSKHYLMRMSDLEYFNLEYFEPEEFSNNHRYKHAMIDHIGDTGCTIIDYCEDDKMTKKISDYYRTRKYFSFYG